MAAWTSPSSRSSTSSSASCARNWRRRPPATTTSRRCGAAATCCATRRATRLRRRVSIFRIQKGARRGALFFFVSPLWERLLSPRLAQRLLHPLGRQFGLLLRDLVIGASGGDHDAVVRQLRETGLRRLPTRLE